MPDWDEDSPRLRQNLLEVMRQARDSARHRQAPCLDLARDWHRGMMAGLGVPDPSWVGTFRGERGAEGVEVRVGKLPGVSSTEVGDELSVFVHKMKRALALLDEELEGGDVETSEHLELVIRTAAWAHAEWVRIHPFANGNGRTARLWANWVLMRFGVLPFVRLRPRPGGEDYGHAAAEAMRGNWRPTVAVFESLSKEALF